MFIPKEFQLENELGCVRWLSVEARITGG